MPTMNAFLDESRSERLEVRLPFLQQVRVSPTIREVLTEEKPANVNWGDFVLTALINHVLTARIVRGDWRGANSLVGRLVGGPPDGLGVSTEEQLASLTGVSRADGRQGGKR